MILKFYKSDNLTGLVLLPIIGSFSGFQHYLVLLLLIFQTLLPCFNGFKFRCPFFQVIALLIIVISALILNDVINKNEIFNRNTFLPALIYLMFMSAIKEHQVLSPIVISNLFWILAFKQLFNIYSQVPCKSKCLTQLFLCCWRSVLFPFYINGSFVWVALKY